MLVTINQNSQWYKRFHNESMSQFFNTHLFITKIITVIKSLTKIEKQNYPKDIFKKLTNFLLNFALFHNFFR